MDFKDMPWQMKVTFIAYTLPTVILILPLLIVALLNPFWFRQGMLRWIEDIVHSFSRHRDKWMKPQLDKWTLFTKIKKS